MKTFTWPLHFSKDRTRQCFYNPHERLWTMQRIDANGDQVGDSEYDNTRRQAMYWLKNGKFIHKNTIL